MSNRSPILGVLVLLMCASVAHAQPTQEYALNFSVLPAGPPPFPVVGSLQFDVDYSGAGGDFVGSGGGVECAKVAGFGALEAFNDDDAASIATLGFADNIGFGTPRSLAKCIFEKPAADPAPVAGDFVITVVAATDTDRNDVNVNPVITLVEVCSCGDDAVSCLEECDDGNSTAGDGCSDTCSCENTCGNGSFEPPCEQCDLGGVCMFGAEPPDTPCTLPLGSECNAGGFCVIDDSRGCNDVCQRTIGSCGDGVVDAGLEDCDDGNTADGDCCDSNCRFEPAASSCSDGDACNGDETCDGAGSCAAGQALDCDDSNVCTDDSCDSVDGCVNTPNTGPCSDGDACTDGDVCAAGECTPGGPLDCDDSNICTDDSCDTIGGCVNAPNTDPCSDGDACTEGDVCAAGACTPGGPLDCNDSNVCTDDSCDSIGGCVNAPNTGPCSDGDACTEGDVCAAGACTPGGQLDCDDSNVCTDDSCDTVGGCVNAPNTDPCSDGDACTEGDVCAAGACTPGGPLDCDDSNVCTDDSCDSVTGCSNDFNTAPCDDGVFCNGVDTCSGGSCSDHAGDPCAGGGECAGACDEAAESCSVPDGTPCSDDGNECTEDVCDGQGACGHEPLADGSACTDDGSFCTGIESCQSGACVSSGDPCAGAAQCADACDEASDDCLAAAGAPCEVEGDLCTTDACDGTGNCVKVDDVRCEAGNSVCEGDSICNPATGLCDPVPAAPEGSMCEEDGDLCTADECDDQGFCIHDVIPGCCSCGDPTGDRVTSATDCLIIIRTAVDIPEVCPLSCCDVDGSNSIRTTDAFLCLRCAVDLPCELSCRLRVAFHVTNEVELGALQFEVDYSGAAGDFPGADDLVECETVLPGATIAFNDDEAGGVLKVAAVHATGFTGPAELAYCSFDPAVLVNPGDFVITITDASDPMGDPPTEEPVVEIMFGPGTDGGPMGTTTTTMP